MILIPIIIIAVVIVVLILYNKDRKNTKNSNYGDTVIGRFNNGKSFSVYLPESYNDRGNMMIEANSLIEKNIGEMLARYKLSVPI